jgi:hypothetical protein
MCAHVVRLSLTFVHRPAFRPPPPDFHPLVDSITYSDYYLLANDFQDYIKTQVGQPAAVVHSYLSTSRRQSVGKVSPG